MKPHQLAVAVEYDQDELGVPLVSAVGKLKMAEMITRVARRYGVPVKANRELATKLAALESNQFIPEDMYQDVAELFVSINRKS